MDVRIEPGWKQVLQEEFEKPYFLALTDFIRKEYQTQTIYPAGKNLFAAFDACPWDQVKVVILGQDPYHGPGQAHGLSFSVPDGVQLPPSLQNIFKELKQDVGVSVQASGNLLRWANQGVLLLNATLTVRAGQAGSHQKQGWEQFTDAVIAKIAAKQTGVVFILWGAYARKKAAMIDIHKHCIIESAHPSPLSAHNGFFGSKPFSKTNHYLISIGKTPIDWS